MSRRSGAAALYPREYLWFVERVLRGYPADKEQLKYLEQAIEAFCRAPSIPESDGRGTNASTEPERVTDAKLRNTHYQKLSCRMKEIKQVWTSLTKQEREIADMLFWQDLKSEEVANELHLDDRWVRRMKVRILQKASLVIIPLWIN
jgi:DNA-directed RNA polymerase specialized sigma subunit